MGILEQPETHRRVTLGTRCLLGRDPKADISLENPQVSVLHASVHWRGDAWELRDLGSRNGTFLEGRRLERGGRATLEPGQVFTLAGSRDAFQLVDATPPAVRARNVLRQEVREASGSLLVLPNDETPVASLFPDKAGRWVLELGESRRYIADHERLPVGAEEWVLELPITAMETIDGESFTLNDVHMKIGVSRDEEHVEVTVEHMGGRQELPPRSHHYLLATLARLWLEENHLPEAERGWVDRENLCRMLATDTNKLNVDIHRVRKQLSTLGLLDAANIVERRQGTGQVRIGVRSVEVFPL